MRRSTPTLVLVLLTALLALGGISCSALRDVTQSISSLTRCKFKIDGVSDFTLVGIRLAGKEGFSLQDGLKLLPAFRDHRFPASFTVNVAALNPNDGTSSSRSTSATLTNLAWTLIIDSVKTLSGDLASPVTIPASGQQTIIPLRMELDLYAFFGERGYDGIVNLALALGGAKSRPGHVQLRAKPTISTQFGPITYPGELTIVDSEFRGQ